MNRQFANQPSNTLALVIDYLMAGLEKTAACNLSTSRMNDDAASKHGGTVHRAPVGEINVLERMSAYGARLFDFTWSGVAGSVKLTPASAFL